MVAFATRCDLDRSSGASTSRGGTPYTDRPRAWRWTRPPSRAGAGSPASAWRWGEPRFPGKVLVTPGGKPGVVSAPTAPPRSASATRPAFGAGGGDSAGRLPCGAAVVRRRLPHARQDGLPLGQPPARPGWGRRGRGAGGVHRRSEEAAAIRRPGRDHDLALRDYRARRPGLAAAAALVVVGDGAGAEPEPRPPASAARVPRRPRVRSGGAARGAGALAPRVSDPARARRAYRTTFILFELEGLSGERIAEITGTRVGTVWVRLTRARRAFIERMRQLEEQEKERP